MLLGLARTTAPPPEHAAALSELLRRCSLRVVYHGSPQPAKFGELARTYQNPVEDSTRAMERLKA
jgi:hypothetical protein